MKRQMKWAAASLICSLIIQCMPAAADQKTQEAFDAYLDRIYAQWISENPFQIHFYLEHPENYGIELSSYTLMDYSEYDEEAIEAYEKQQEEDLKELRSFDKTQLTRQQQILYDKLMVQIDLNEKYTDMFDFSSLIGGSNGIVNSLANDFQNYLFIEKKDVEEYLKFLQDIPNYIDYAIDYTNEYAEYDLVPSKYMLQVNSEAIDELVGKNTNVFIEGFEKKLDEAAFLSDEERADFKTKNKELVEQIVNPAFAKLKQQLSQWQETFDELEGFAEYAEGEDYYNYLIETYAGVSMDAEELFDYMYDKLDDCEERFSELLEDDEIYEGYMNSEYGFEKRTPSEILDALRVYTKENFAPIADPGYQVEELPTALRSDGVLAYYLTPQEDNDDINQICLNPDALGTDLGVLYETLAHEGYPGHLYFFNYVKQQGWHPINFFVSNIGFEEGWAEYAARLSLDSWGLDPDMMEVIFLDQEFSYLLMGLSDIGINYGGWTVDDVYDLWETYFYLDSAEDVRDVYDACMAEPGTILSYSIGYYQICDLEEEVKEMLGESFDHNEFVTELLSVGGASFDITRSYIMEWANEKLHG